VSALVAKELQEQNRILEQLVGNYLLDKFYPIGSIYTSTNDVNPSLTMGGTWERLKDRFLLGAGDSYTAGATGGSATHNHTHDLWADMYMLKDDSAVRSNGAMYMKGKQHSKHSIMDYALQDQKDSQGNYLLSRKDLSGVSYQYGTNVDGSINQANNMPPYLAVYMWKRVG
jgi:hypothetical protein